MSLAKDVIHQDKHEGTRPWVVETFQSGRSLSSHCCLSHCPQDPPNGTSAPFTLCSFHSTQCQNPTGAECHLPIHHSAEETEVSNCTSLTPPRPRQRTPISAEPHLCTCQPAHTYMHMNIHVCSYTRAHELCVHTLCTDSQLQAGEYTCRHTMHGHTAHMCTHAVHTLCTHTPPHRHTCACLYPQQVSLRWRGFLPALRGLLPAS